MITLLCIIIVFLVIALVVSISVAFIQYKKRKEIERKYKLNLRVQSIVYTDND